MSLPLTSILADRVYSHTSPRTGTLLYRRVINIGSWTECTSPGCRHPLRLTGAGADEEREYAPGVWVRYETVISGVWLIRSCSLEAFARWAEGRLTLREGERVFPRRRLIA